MKQKVMKVLLLLAVMACSQCFSQRVVLTNSEVSEYRIGSEQSALRIQQYVATTSLPGSRFAEHDVVWLSYGTGDIQALTPVFVFWEIEVTNVAFGRRIDSTYPVVRGQQPAQFPPNPDGASNVLGGLLGYTFAIGYSINGEPVSTNYTDLQAQTRFLRGLTNAYFAFRQLQADGFHYGWYQVQRSAPNGYVPWYIVNAVAHPVADEPIQAGLPPPQPVIEAHVTAAAPPETDSTVRLTWPNAYRNYRLEQASTLEPPILWEPVDLVGTNHVSLPLGGSNVFYRLSPP
jgi:hypothetical protein